MSLRRFAVENYRCFRDRQELEISPVTVVLGKNNSGKSALVRTPLVLSTGFGSSTTAPLALERLGADAPDSFTDLIFGQVAHRPISFELETDGEDAFRMSVELQFIDELQQAFVSSIVIGNGEIGTRLAWSADLLRGVLVPLYDLGRSGVQPVEFDGLHPLVKDLKDWKPGLGPMRYLSSYRERADRHHRLPFGEPRELGSRAEHVAAILTHDKARNGGQLLDVVNGYLSRIVPGWRLDVVSSGPLWTTVVTRDNERVRVNLADAGSGLAQVLPILVQCGLDQIQEASSPALQIIEEPEMHLHPAAHAELADLYLATASATGTRFLVETHSETLLLRLRLRVAQGHCSPQDVAVYVVEQADGVSTVRRVSIDDLGNLGDEWPEGYFSQDYHEVRAIAAAQLDRSSGAA